jgi:hypothetical protein
MSGAILVLPHMSSLRRTQFSEGTIHTFLPFTCRTTAIPAAVEAILEL